MNPILVEKHRGNSIESFHRGVICIVNEKKEVVFSVGDVHQMCYPRSALKLIQVLPLLESGAVEKFGFNLQEVAIMCGSHNGEVAHTEVVSSILHKIGLDKLNLKCGQQMPTLNEDKNKLIISGHKPEHIHNNCSGKHAGFLAYCVFNRYSIDDYLLESHPLHQDIKKVASEVYEYDMEKMPVGIDGCSAPIFGIPVYNQAVAYMKIAYPEGLSPERKKAIELMQKAITSYPYMIAGKKRYCTDVITEGKGNIIGKTGADGVYCLSFIEQKLGCCIKIDDGLMGPQYAVAQAIIEKLGLLDEESIKKLHPYLEENILNWNGWTVGKQIVCPTVLDDLKI